LEYRTWSVSKICKLKIKYSVIEHTSFEKTESETDKLLSVIFTVVDLIIYIN
jgi:hypothetical protein